MHILFITSNKNFFNEKSEEQKLLQAMIGAAEVLHVVVFTKRRDGFAIRKLNDHAWIYPTNSLFSWLYPVDALWVIRLQILWQGEFRAHIIHSDDPFLSGWLGVLLARWYERVWMVNLHRYYWDYASPLYAIVARIQTVPVSLMIRWALRICVFSERVRIFMAQAAGTQNAKKIFLLKEPRDLSAIRNAPITVDVKREYPEYNFVVLVAAQLEVGNSVGLALETLALLRQQYGKAAMLFVGGGRLKSLYTLKARSLGVSQWVQFLKDPPELISFYKTANLFLYLASGEEEDEYLITAAMAGCPVVALPNALSEGIIKDGQNGIIAGHATPQVIVAAIRRFNEFPGLREQFKINSAMYLTDAVIDSDETFAARLRECWTYEEAPPPELYLEHPLLSDLSQGDNIALRIREAARKFFSKFKKQP